MRSVVVLALLVPNLIGGVSETSRAQDKAAIRRLSVAEYRDRVAGGWLGQMLGVGWGAPTEFKFNGVIIPEDEVPEWTPDRINQYNQDDIYVEMTFLRTMELYGFDVSIRQAGIDFANSGYRLWHANRYGRENLRAGIAPPDSGHPKFNAHADDIDYQIEADYSGLIAPGMPNVGIELGEKFGRLMNYGDGLYGGQFVAGMYAEAFFEDDPRELIEAGLACIPAGSRYAATIRDVLAWYDDEPEDWQAVWQKINEKYHLNPENRLFSCKTGAFNIDAKINGAYIAMGLLYGDRDIERTTVISMRCGQDSDCNPSSAAGILCTTLGASRMPKEFTSALERGPKFSHTQYDFDGLLAVCEKLARQAVVDQGGRIATEPNGSEVFVIPVRRPKPSALEQCWEPGPVANSRFTEAELELIETSSTAVKLREDLGKVLPGWSIANCGDAMTVGLLDSFRGKSNVFATHPQARNVPCVLSRKVEIPSSRNPSLRVTVSHDPRGDWLLLLKVNSTFVGEPRKISAETCPKGWCDVEYDLSDWAGKTVELELLNRPTGWHFEAGYWAEVSLDAGPK